MANGNVFLDKEFAQTGPTPAQGARRLVNMAKQQLQQQQVFLENVRKVVSVHGRAALVAELGTDEGVALQTLYTDIKATVEKSAPNISVAEMD